MEPELLRYERRQMGLALDDVDQLAPGARHLVLVAGCEVPRRR
jgi:hypothetical protein